MLYPYPPSDNLLEYGKLFEDGYFFVDGNMHGGEGFSSVEIECFFEVGYNEHLQVVAVCYPKNLTIAQINYFQECLQSPGSKIIGTDLRSSQTVILDGLTLINFVQHLTPAGAAGEFNSDLQFVIQAQVCQEFSSFASKDESAVDYIHVDVVGLEEDSLPKPESLFFPNEYKDGVPFKFVDNAEKHLNLLFRKNADETSQLKPVWLLRIPPASLPPNWTPDFTANFWCALVSLGLGCDVQWITISFPFPFPAHNPDFYKQRIWCSRTATLNRATNNLVAPVTIDISALVNLGNHPLSDIPNWLGFVENILRSSVRSKISLQELSCYITVIQNYISYRLTRHSVGLGELRLVTTLTEELLFTWQKYAGKEPAALLTKGERRKLERVVEEALSTVAGTSADYLSENQHNRAQINKRILSLLRDNIRQVTFAEGLEQFFQFYGYKDDLTRRRVRAFVDTRNSIAHRGKLSWQEDDVVDRDLIDFGEPHDEKEQANALMIIPLMLFCILGYQGPYYDLLFSDEIRILTPHNDTTTGLE